MRSSLICSFPSSFSPVTPSIQTVSKPAYSISQPAAQPGCSTQHLPQALPSLHSSQRDLAKTGNPIKQDTPLLQPCPVPLLHCKPFLVPLSHLLLWPPLDCYTPATLGSFKHAKLFATRGSTDSEQWWPSKSQWIVLLILHYGLGRFSSKKPFLQCSSCTVLYLTVCFASYLFTDWNLGSNVLLFLVIYW